MTFAGLWDEWKDHAGGEKLKSCTMIVTEPNAVAAKIHDRMPVILERTDFYAWLNCESQPASCETTSIERA